MPISNISQTKMNSILEPFEISLIFYGVQGVFSLEQRLSATFSRIARFVE
jgi:hypothetical protein